MTTEAQRAAAKVASAAMVKPGTTEVVAEEEVVLTRSEVIEALPRMAAITKLKPVVDCAAVNMVALRSGPATALTGMRQPKPK